MTFEEINVYFREAISSATAPALKETLRFSVDKTFEAHEEILTRYTERFLATARPHFHVQGFDDLDQVPLHIHHRTNLLLQILKDMTRELAENETAFLSVSSDIIDALRQRYESEQVK